MSRGYMDFFKNNNMMDSYNNSIPMKLRKNELKDTHLRDFPFFPSTGGSEITYKVSPNNIIGLETGLETTTNKIVNYNALNWGRTVNFGRIDLLKEACVQLTWPVGENPANYFLGILITTTNVPTIDLTKVTYPTQPNLQTYINTINTTAVDLRLNSDGTQRFYVNNVIQLDNTQPNMTANADYKLIDFGNYVSIRHNASTLTYCGNFGTFTMASPLNPYLVVYFASKTGNSHLPFSVWSYGYDGILKMPFNRIVSRRHEFLTNVNCAELETVPYLLNVGSKGSFTFSVPTLDSLNLTYKIYIGVASSPVYRYFSNYLDFNNFVNSGPTINSSSKFQQLDNVFGNGTTRLFFEVKSGYIQFTSPNHSNILTTSTSNIFLWVGFISSRVSEVMQCVYYPEISESLETPKTYVIPVPKQLKNYSFAALKINSRRSFILNIASTNMNTVNLVFSNSENYEFLEGLTGTFNIFQNNYASFPYQQNRLETSLGLGMPTITGVASSALNLITVTEDFICVNPITSQTQGGTKYIYHSGFPKYMGAMTSQISSVGFSNGGDVSNTIITSSIDTNVIIPVQQNFYNNYNSNFVQAFAGVANNSGVIVIPGTTYGDFAFSPTYKNSFIIRLQVSSFDTNARLTFGLAPSTSPIVAGNISSTLVFDNTFVASTNSYFGYIFRNNTVIASGLSRTTSTYIPNLVSFWQMFFYNGQLFIGEVNSSFGPVCYEAIAENLNTSINYKLIVANRTQITGYSLGYTIYNALNPNILGN